MHRWLRDWLIIIVFKCVHQLSKLKQRLKEAEAERDKLLEELKGGHGIGASDSEDLDEMLDFPGIQPLYPSRAFPPLSRQDAHWFTFDLVSFEPFPLEKLLSKRSRASPAHNGANFQTDTDSASPSPGPADPETVAELRQQIEELTSQNSELVLKVQVRPDTQLIFEHTHTHSVTGLFKKEKLGVKWLLNGSLAEDEESASLVSCDHSTVGSGTLMH